MKAFYLIIPFAPLLAAIVAGLLGRQIGRVGAHSVTIFAVLLSFLCSCVVFWDVLEGNTFNGPVYTWLTSGGDRKSTRLNSSHSQISYAVFCLKKKIRTSHI